MGLFGSTRDHHKWQTTAIKMSTLFSVHRAKTVLYSIDYFYWANYRKEESMAYKGSQEFDLSLLALEAAIEFECIINKQCGNVGAIERLSEQINNFAQQSCGAEPRLFSDPNAAAIMNQAIIESRWASNINNISQLVIEANTISRELISKEISAPAFLVKMKEFCIALSKSAASSRMSIHDLRPNHPNRC